MVTLFLRLKKLAETVACIQRGSEACLPSPDVPVSEPLPTVGNNVMTEVREVYEHEKRKSFIIIRGVGNASEDEVANIFLQICDYLNARQIELL